MIARLTLIFFTLYFLQATLFKKFEKTYRNFWELSYLFLVMPLIFPQQQKYSFVYMAPFFAYVVLYFMLKQNLKNSTRGKVCIGTFVIIVLLTTVTSDLFVGLELGYVFQVLKLLTIGALIAVPLLAVCKPQEIETT